MNITLETKFTVYYKYSCKNLGKLQALSGVTKDQRREYKSKFVDMDIEFQRMKERLETIHLILDDMQVCIIPFKSCISSTLNLTQLFFEILFTEETFMS